MNDNFYKRLLTTVSVLGIAGVAFGAFGAHFLRSRLDPESMEVIRTAILYLFIHTLATLLIILLGRTDTSSRVLKITGVFFVVGVILFTGSLLLIATRALTGFQAGFIGFATPLGGVFFISAWACLLYYSLTRKI